MHRTQWRMPKSKSPSFLAENCNDEFRHGSGSSTVDDVSFMRSLTSAEEESFNIDDADLYIVNDAYRPTPTKIILRWLEISGKLSQRVKFLVSTGCHRSPDQNQMYDIFGELYDSLKDRIFVHDARDKKSLELIGNDDRLGGMIMLNRLYVEAKKVVVVGSVEPHYFAGFTGGRKSIFPGLCDFDTVVRNHRLATSREAMPLRLDGNPIEEHFRYMMQMVPTDKIFSIQIVQGEKGEMAGIFCGDIVESFNRAKEQSKRLFGIDVDAKYDLLFAEVQPPLDRNLYQLQKSLENCQSAVRDGGKIMLFSSCSEGIGEDSFYELADRWNPELENQPTDNFGIHKLRRVYDIGKRIDVNLFSELPGGVPDKVFFKSMEKPQAVIDGFIKDNMAVCLVRDAGHTVLISKN
jgi:nickel-dependent lactate racemase